MHIQKSRLFACVAMLSLNLILQSCRQSHQEFGHLELPDTSEQAISATSQGLPPVCGPFVTASGGLVTFQQEKDSWTAKVQEISPLVREQQLAVGCVGNITKTLLQLQCQPTDYVKSCIHVLSPMQSPTGKSVVYLGKLGLSGGMEQEEAKNETFSVSLSYLHQAVQSGDLAAVKYLVEEKRADVNVRDDLGNTVLHWAAETGQLEVMKYFVEEKNVDVHALNDDEVSVLHLAVEKEYFDIIQYLVEGKEVNVNTPNNWGMTALHLAAAKGTLAIVKYLVEEQRADMSARTFLGKTALHWAIEKGHLAVVKYFVEGEKTDVSALDDLKKTALHLASEKGHLAVVKYLVEKGADVNALDDFERTVLHLAAEKGHLVVVKYFVEEENADVHAKNYWGMTVPHLAVQEGHLAVMQYLVEEKKVSANVQDYWGMTVLHCAAREGHLKIVEYLVEKEADVNARDDFGRTALHWAAEEGHLSVIQYLVAKKADVKAQNYWGTTVLHYAAQEGHPAVIKYLVEKEANANARDNQGMSLLYYAAQKGNLEIISYLMEEAKGDLDYRIIESLRRSCFARWENVELYVRLITIADRLYSGKDLRACQEEIDVLTDASLKLKLAYKEQESRKECPHDLTTAFCNRLNTRIRREGVPDAMLFDPEAYFKDIRLHDSLKKVCQAIIEWINAGRETYLLHASSLVALLEANEEISSTPLSFILCPPGNFKPYDPEDLIQRRTVEFYTQRSAKLARLVKNEEDVNRDLFSTEIEKALCKYLEAYLSQLEFRTELIEAVQENDVKKDLIVNQIESMLVEDEVLLPVGIREKLVYLLLEVLLRPNAP